METSNKLHGGDLSSVGFKTLRSYKAVLHEITFKIHDEIQDLELRIKDLQDRNWSFGNADQIKSLSQHKWKLQEYSRTVNREIDDINKALEEHITEAGF